MAGKTVAARVHDLHESLTGAGRKVARGLLGNYPMLGLAPVAEFAEGAGVSAATIVLNAYAIVVPITTRTSMFAPPPRSACHAPT